MATKRRSFITTPDDSALLPGNRGAATSLITEVAPADRAGAPRRR